MEKSSQAGSLTGVDEAAADAGKFHADFQNST